MEAIVPQTQRKVMLWGSLLFPSGKALLSSTLCYGLLCYIACTCFAILPFVGIQDVGSLREVRSLLNAPLYSILAPLCTVFFAYLSAKKCFGITEKYNMQTLPMHFIETTLWIGALGILTFLPLGGLLTLLSHVLLSTTVIALEFQSKEKIRVVVTPVLSKSPPPSPVIRLQQRPTCSVCQQPSIYEICMECEHTYQKEIQRVKTQNWRAKKAGEPATLTLAPWLQTLEYFRYHCAYCQTGPYECMEHYYPIGSFEPGGGTTAKNCVPACIKCNTGKSNKHPEE